MKKLMIAVVAMLSMTTATFAADEATEATAVYNMNVNMDRLADALGMNMDQEEALEDVHKNFTAELMSAASLKGDEKDAKINKAVLNDLKYAHAILSKSQYRKYLLLLNTTMVNRGIIK